MRSVVVVVQKLLVATFSSLPAVSLTGRFVSRYDEVEPQLNQTS
jgi:hypothetical protein